MADLKKDELVAVADLAVTGDVFLVVGPEQLKLRVHSLILKTTSKPFTAMLGPNWTKDHDQPNIDKPMEIPLPEDNAISIKYICAITHYQNQMVPETLAAQDVLEIAITADKYDVVDALALAIRPWLRACDKSAAELMLLATAAYLFRSPQAFREITKALVLDYDGSYLPLLTEQIEGIIDWRIICE